MRPYETRGTSNCVAEVTKGAQIGEQSCFSFFCFFSSFFFFFFFLVFLGPHPWHTEVPRLGTESEPQRLAYATDTATPDFSHICDLHHSSQQCQILNPRNKARDESVSSWILVGCITTEPRQELSPLFFHVTHF